MATTLAGYRSWFNSTKYSILDEMDDMLGNDPVFNLLGEITDGGKEDSINFTGRANHGYAPVVQPGARIPEKNPVEADQLSKNFFSVKSRTVVEWEAYVHDKYDFVKESATELYSQLTNTIGYAFNAQLLNNANSSAVTLPGGFSYSLLCADAQNFASASHTVPGKVGSVYTNISGPSALSGTSLNTAIQVGKANMMTVGGISMGFAPDLLIIPDNQLMIEKAMQLTKSDKVSESANNAINIYTGGSMKVVVLNHSPRDAAGSYDTTKQYYWAVANSTQLKKSVKYKWAAKPTPFFGFRDVDNLDSSIAVAARVAIGAPLWQGIVFNFSTTAPTNAN